MTRQQSKAATRERLLSAARRVFARRGFHGASVDEVAAEAGFSTGALYSNFGGKEDLFLELMEHEVSSKIADIAAAVDETASMAERAQGGAAQWMSFVEREPEMLLLFMEFWAYAVRDPAVRPQMAARFADIRRMLTRLITDGLSDFGLEPAIPVEQLAMAVDALADGIARQKLADPRAVPDGLLGSALSLLLAGAVRPAAGGQAHEEGTQHRSSALLTGSPPGRPG